MEQNNIKYPTIIIDSLDFKLTFGKYRGKTIDYLINNYPDYTSWLFKQKNIIVNGGLKSNFKYTLWLSI